MHHHYHNNNAFRENTFDRETATHNAPAPHVGVMAVELDTLSHQRLRVGRERVRARVNVVGTEIIKPEVIDEEQFRLPLFKEREVVFWESVSVENNPIGVQRGGNSIGFGGVCLIAF